MTAEIKDMMEKLDLSREKIFTLTSKCLDFISNHPTQIQKLIDTWSKSLEVSSQRLSLLFLCNDLIRNSVSEVTRSLFQFSMSRAINLVCSDFSTIVEVRKLLKIWGDYQVFSKVSLEDWEKICDRAEQFGSITDRSHYLYIISLGKKLKQLKRSSEGKNIQSLEEHKSREELMKEIVFCMKKVFHGQLELTICLQRLNLKVDNAEVIS
jgi:hypothetical protein